MCTGSEAGCTAAPKAADDRSRYSYRAAFMIVIVFVGGIGTYERPFRGAALFFTIETLFGASGVTYLVGLGATALLFALLLPRGIWGEIEHLLGLQLLLPGYRLRAAAVDTAARE
jgi:branched-chain amino acid transport system permease protein